MNIQFTLKKNICLLVACIAFVWTSCRLEKISPVAESAKDITGTWKVISATRNGTNLIPVFDFSQFNIKFDASAGTYSLVNPVPFIIAADGKFALDDPNFPFKITFTATGSSSVTTVFNYPIVSGARQITLTFSPGCAQNSYVYTLIKK
ncbi:MAG: hypothetical protein JWQ34_728 [Mucilaginibacter sp.]|uniref:DUF5004 domain-containing protein n=1 Tax=Mucilaginibacter sp. TaxID=1882438 RepID=UPI00261D4577|nr:DUF5004 domain-containing protein [Mucilaginibacter sp.]MDB5002503.1 hypothetical protein [Mucilaginibacter sp.]